jgi:hypothetical protein
VFGPRGGGRESRCERRPGRRVGLEGEGLAREEDSVGGLASSTWDTELPPDKSRGMALRASRTAFMTPREAATVRAFQVGETTPIMTAPRFQTIRIGLRDGGLLAAAKAFFLDGGSPRRKSSGTEVRRSRWFRALSAEDREMHAGVIGFAADSAVRNSERVLLNCEPRHGAYRAAMND